MPEPPDKPRRPRSYGNLTIPPKRRGEPDEVPGEDVFLLIKQTHDDVVHIKGKVERHGETLEEHGRQLEEHEREIQDLRQIHNDVKDIRVDVKEMRRASLVDAREDAVSARQLAAWQIEQERWRRATELALIQNAEKQGKDAGGVAGARRGTLGGGLAALLIGVLSYIGHLLLVASQSGH